MGRASLRERRENKYSGAPEELAGVGCVRRVRAAGVARELAVFGGSWRGPLRALWLGDCMIVERCVSLGVFWFFELRVKFD